MHAGIIADLGQTPNSSVTLSHLVANDPGVRAFSVAPPTLWLPWMLLTSAVLGPPVCRAHR